MASLFRRATTRNVRHPVIKRSYHVRLSWTCKRSRWFFHFGKTILLKGAHKWLKVGLISCKHTGNLDWKINGFWREGGGYKGGGGVMEVFGGGGRWFENQTLTLCLLGIQLPFFNQRIQLGSICKICIFMFDWFMRAEISCRKIKWYRICLNVSRFSTLVQLPIHYFTS